MRSKLGYPLYRWLLFFLIGLPVQAICYILWPLLLTYYLWSRSRLQGSFVIAPKEKWTLTDLIKFGRYDIFRDHYFLDTPDDHAALVHGYAWVLHQEKGFHGLKLLVDRENDTLLRRYPNNSGVPVSGDCLMGWVAHYVYRMGRHWDRPSEELRALANSYIKNCMGLPAEPLGFKVSNRSSNSGMNYTPDSWGGINQPCLGPQYFTSAALLRTAAREFGGWYWLVYFLHYWLMGGWLYSLLPAYHTHGNPLYYVQHITMLGIYAVAKDNPNPIYRWTQWWITEFMSPRGFVNPLFECYRADCGNAGQTQILSALWKCKRFKHVWPQIWPGREDWYEADNGEHHGVVAGAAKMLLDSVDLSKLKKGARGIASRPWTSLRSLR